MTSPLRVLSLYRAILKLGRSWKGDLEVQTLLKQELMISQSHCCILILHLLEDACLDLQEKQYIFSEAKKVFRQNKDASSPEEVESLVRS